MPVKKLTQMAMLAAISIVLVFFIRLPIIPAAPFLEYTPGDVPLMLAAFIFGPASGLILVFVTAVIQGVTVSAHSGIIGIVMNILAGGSYVLVAGLIYSKSQNKTVMSLILAMAAGIVTTTVTMVGWNLIFVPIFLGVPREVVLNMIIPVFIPFNIIRMGLNSVFTFILYKSLKTLIPGWLG